MLDVGLFPESITGAAAEVTVTESMVKSAGGEVWEKKMSVLHKNLWSGVVSRGWVRKYTGCVCG